MPKVICLILGGGRGTRLYPLTKSRSKPAVPIAGKYRLIDIPISNCINSGLNQIYVLTQFNSVSLHRHIANTFKFDPFNGGFVEILAAQPTKTPEALARVRTAPEWFARHGINAEGRPYLASMGIYLFNRSTLVEMLASTTATDFGRELFPQAINSHRVQAHLFDGYWEDIGTV